MASILRFFGILKDDYLTPLQFRYGRQRLD
jgi:hypothetical protein